MRPGGHPAPMSQNDRLSCRMCRGFDIGSRLEGETMSMLDRLHRPLHHKAVHVFRRAAERGDGERLAELLDPGVAVVVDLDGDTVSSARVALTGATSTATRLTSVEDALAGKALTDETVVATVHVIPSEGADPLALPALVSGWLKSKYEIDHVTVQVDPRGTVWRPLARRTGGR